jgi:class 3 adenylate cyclase
VRCAIALRDALASLGLDMRAGVHIGEIELRGNDIAGMTVHTASRIESIAQSGEILMSRTVVDLIVGSGIEVSPRGEHEFKGVPAPVTVYALNDR